MNITDELFAASRRLAEFSRRLGESDFSDGLSKLEEAAVKVGKSWSGSWLGYHSRVYYSDFQQPAAKDYFDQEWGGTSDQWIEHTFDYVMNYIKKIAGEPDILKQESESRDAEDEFDESQSLILSRLTIALKNTPDDAFLIDLLTKAKQEKYVNENELIRQWCPTGKVSRDTRAVFAGSHVPPHYSIMAQVAAIRQPFLACNRLDKIARRAGIHITGKTTGLSNGESVGTKVFIGHGHSLIWIELKDFIQDRLHLPWDEYNRVSTAGIANTDRLSQMLDSAALALLILTAEDEQNDGTVHARLNVIHEAGLFQGRLGFKRAIILLENGCEEFSNIQGLGQVRFPKGNIAAIFEEIRRVLEREGLIES